MPSRLHSLLVASVIFAIPLARQTVLQSLLWVWETYWKCTVLGSLTLSSSGSPTKPLPYNNPEHTGPYVRARKIKNKKRQAKTAQWQQYIRWQLGLLCVLIESRPPRICLALNWARKIHGKRRQVADRLTQTESCIRAFDPNKQTSLIPPDCIYTKWLVFSHFVCLLEPNESMQCRRNTEKSCLIEFIYLANMEGKSVPR